MNEFRLLGVSIQVCWLPILLTRYLLPDLEYILILSIGGSVLLLLMALTINKLVYKMEITKLNLKFANAKVEILMQELKEKHKAKLKRIEKLKTKKQKK